MIKGSLYILGEDSLARYSGEGDKFEQIRLDDNYDIVGRNFNLNYDPRIPRTIWSTPPHIRRTYHKGDPIIALRSGPFTICPRYARVISSDGRYVICGGKRIGTVVFYLKLIRSAKYAECDANCKRATIYWLLVSKKMGFPRDMRRLIGEYIWESRDAREWENSE